MVRGRKQRAPPVLSPVQKTARQMSLHKFESELNELRGSIMDKNVERKTAEFYSLTKRSLRELLAIKYEATFQEIVDEIEKKKHYSTKFREELDSFLEEVSLMEYGYAHFEELLEEKRKAQEKHLMGYLHDLEKVDGKVDAKTKKKIAAIVSDSVPHSNREYLVKMMDDFRSIMHQL